MPAKNKIVRLTIKDADKTTVKQLTEILFAMTAGTGISYPIAEINFLLPVDCSKEIVLDIVIKKSHDSTASI